MLFILLVLVVLSQSAPAQTTLLLENFNNGSLPNGWDVQIIRGERQWGFGLFNNDDTGVTSMNGSAFAWFDDDGMGNDLQFAPASRAMLLTPWLDGTEFAHYLLEFDAIAKHNVEKERLEIGVWDGTELRIAKTYTGNLAGPLFEQFSHEKVDLSFFRAPQFRIAFVYDDGMGWGWWTGIDNVSISGDGFINDICEQAPAVFLNGPCVPGENATAIFTGSQPDCTASEFNQAAVNALWYRYFALSSSMVEIATHASFNDVITVYDGTCDNLQTELCTNRDEFGFTSESLYFNAQAGHHYLIKISGLRGAYGFEKGALCLELHSDTPPPVPPANDHCLNAIPLVVDDHCLDGNNFNGGLDGPLPDQNEFFRADIWYRFAATVPNVEILSNTDFADVIALYEGGCASPLEVVMTRRGKRLIAKNLNIGEVYLIQVSGLFATVEGNVCIEVKSYMEPLPPENDQCFSAIPMTIGAECVPVSNVSAQMDGPAPSCCENPAADVWFQFVAPASGMVQMNTGAGFPAAVALYEGPCSDLKEINCFNNPLSCDGYFKIKDLTPGQIYFLQIATLMEEDGYIPEGGLCLHLLDGQDSPPPPLKLHMAVECLSDSLGKLHVEASGGTGDYAFQGNVNGEILHHGDSFLVVVTDTSGCEKAVAGTIECKGFNCSITAAITQNDASCPSYPDGKATVLPAGGSGMYFYLWNDENHQTSMTATGLKAGTYRVTVSDELGCSAEAEAVISQPAGMTFVLDNLTPETASGAGDGSIEITMSGGTTPYFFEWLLNGEVVSQEEDPTGLSAGNYNLWVTDKNGCQSLLKTVTVESLVATRLTQTPELHLQIFPNPSGGVFNVAVLASQTGQLSMELFSISGKKIDASITAHPETGVVSIDLSNFPSGVYLLKANSNNVVAVKKLVLTH